MVNLLLFPTNTFIIIATIVKVAINIVTSVILAVTANTIVNLAKKSKKHVINSYSSKKKIQSVPTLLLCLFTCKPKL